MCGGSCGRYDTGPICKCAVSVRWYDTDDSRYLDGSYPGQALLSPIRAHTVLDLSQNIRDG